MINWFIRNTVAANLLMFSIILGGLLAFSNKVLLEVFPPGDLRMVTVSVPLRGATPEDAELGIAVRVEEAVQDLEGVKEIVSTSAEGSTSISIEIAEGYDERELLADIKSRVDAINTLPADAEKPIISLAQWQYAVIDLVVSANLPEVELRTYTEQIRDEILRIDGISVAEIEFGRNYEINIEVSQDKLRDAQLTLSDVANLIRESSLDISAGNLRAQGGDVLIRSKGQAYRKNDFESIVVKTNPDGSILRIADIATVRDGFEEDSMSSRFDGKKTLFVKVYRASTEGALDIAENVHQYIADKQDKLPQGVELSYWDDDSELLKSRLGTLVNNIWQGGLLVILLLTLFLRPAVSFWVFIGIPISFIGAFMVLGFLDVSINMMSLYGFILVLGLVVDDAIVTGESIYTSLAEHGPGDHAAIEGTHRVAIPVTFGVLTTIAAFMPMLALDGHMSRMMEPVPIVIGAILMFSLIESKFVLPAHLKNIEVRRRNNAGNRNGWFRRFELWQQDFAYGFEQSIIKYYKPALEVAVRNRYSVLAAFIGLFALALSLLLKGWLPFTFMPRIPAETVAASLTMPVGTPFEVTDRHIARMTEAAEQIREKYTDADGNSAIRHILSVSGGNGRGGAATHRGRVAIETVPLAERTIELDPAEVTREWRKLIGPIAGAESLNMRSELFRFGDPVNIQLSGNSLETLGKVADKVKQQLAGYPTVFDVSDSLSDGKDELRVELTDQGTVLGLTRSSILRQISEAFRGFEAQRIQRGRDDVRVLVRLPKNERSNQDTLNELLMTTPDGRQVPLAHVAEISPSTGPSTIRRVDRYRVVNVTADFDKKKTNAITLNTDLARFLDELLAQYPGISYSLEGEAREQRETTQSLSAALVALLFLIYCLLALPLKSYTQPLIVMSIIPFSLIGAVIGHLIMGHYFAIVSYMGLLALVGVVINDSLVLVDFVNQSRRKGMALFDAVISAGPRRFRAVMLTSVTTFVGLMPMMFVSSTQSLFMIPMAISLGFGILFATAITLFLVPCNMLIANDIGNGLRSFFRRAGNTEVAT